MENKVIDTLSDYMNDETMVSPAERERINFEISLIGKMIEAREEKGLLLHRLNIVLCRIGRSRSFEEVAKTGMKIAVKNNRPACVLLSPEKDVRP